jgi:hypothetical protein
VSPYILILPEVGCAVWIDRWRGLVGVEDADALVTWSSYVDGAPVVVERVQDFTAGMEAELKRREVEFESRIWS